MSRINEGPFGLNWITRQRDFKKTSLGRSFLNRPLGFVDIGSSGGIHPLAKPAASLIHALCFEPDQEGARCLRAAYEKNKVFSKLSVHEAAVASRRGQREFYLTKSRVNSSLLKPEEQLIRRYQAHGFSITGTLRVETQSLDDIIFRSMKGTGFRGEFLKIDCQGNEYEVLQGGSRVLDEHCMALLCEVELTRMYQDQKLFSDVDMFLRKKNFYLYGLFPHYICARKMDRRQGDGQERILWADALYFKDPLEKKSPSAKPRDINVLILAGLLTGYYDFVLELIDHSLGRKPDAAYLRALVRTMSHREKAWLVNDFKTCLRNSRLVPKKMFVAARKFMDRHRGNTDLDFLKEDIS